MDDDFDEQGFDIYKRYNKNFISHVLDKRTLYSNAIKKKMDVLCVNPKQSFFYGSAILKNLTMVAGDYDIWEKFKASDNISDIVKDIQKIIKEFKDGNQKFFIEFKSGVVEDAILYIGYLENGEIYEYDYEFINEQIAAKPYLKSLKKFVVKNPKIENWMVLYDENRLLYVLRWSMDEVLKGKKKMLNGQTITLEKSITQPTLTKIETMFNINGRFVGFSNYYDVDRFNSNMNEFEQSLRLNTLRMFKDEKWMKVIKRIFALEKNFLKNKKVIECIYTFLVGPVGRLGRVNTDLKAIQEIITTKHYVPMKKTIQCELDNMIDILSGIDIVDIDYNKLDMLLNDAINDVNIKRFYNVLDKLIHYIGDIIQKHALKFMRLNHLYPLPNKYMPTTTKDIMLYNLI